jgi:hypothetical protein
MWTLLEEEGNFTICGYSRALDHSMHGFSHHYDFGCLKVSIF